MGEAKRRNKYIKKPNWPHADSYFGTIDLHTLAPRPSINGARIRELTGDSAIADNVQVILRAFHGVVGERSFLVGFCIGNETGFSPIGIAVIERLVMEAPDKPVYVVPIAHEEIAWDIVLRHLRTFTAHILVFAFKDSDIYDAGTAEISYSGDVRQFDPNGVQLARLTAAQRRRVREQKAATLNRPPPPTFYTAPGIAPEDSPWIFRLVTPAGKIVRTAVWNGRRNYAHSMPEDIIQWVGGDKIAIVQVDSPVGVNRRSSLDLTHKLSKDYDGVIHWARDTETFQSIVQSFVRLDLESVSPQELPAGWDPEITIMPANNSTQ